MHIYNSLVWTPTLRELMYSIFKRSCGFRDAQNRWTNRIVDVKSHSTLETKNNVFLAIKLIFARGEHSMLPPSQERVKQQWNHFHLDKYIWLERIHQHKLHRRKDVSTHLHCCTHTWVWRQNFHIPSAWSQDRPGDIQRPSWGWSFEGWVHFQISLCQRVVWVQFGDKFSAWSSYNQMCLRPALEK